MSEIKLLPCPFCGGKAIIHHNGLTEKDHVNCLDCCCRTKDSITTEEAIEQWNTRKQMERIIDELVNLKKCYLGDEDAVMKPKSFADYIQEIIEKAGGENEI